MSWQKVKVLTAKQNAPKQGKVCNSCNMFPIDELRDPHAQGLYGELVTPPGELATI